MKNKLIILGTKARKALKNKYVLLGLAVLAIIVLFFAFKGGSAKSESVTLKRGDFVKTTSVSGKVVASESVDLSFETGGTVAAVYRKAGDHVARGAVIASLNASDIRASRDKAAADLLAEQAELSKLKKSGSFDAQTDADKQKLVNSIISAYTKSDDAIRNKVDQYFRDSTLSNPRISYTFYDSVNKAGEIGALRADIEKTLKNFQSLVSGLNTSNYSPTILSNAKRYIREVKDFLDKLAPAVNTFDTGSNLSQTTADKYKSDLSTARFSINESIEDITSFESALQGGVADIEVQEARVKAAEASVRGYDADLGKMAIVAPFAGVVSMQDAKVGQAVGANTKVASLISESLQVEVFIPEISLPGIALGNSATVVLDAYTDKTFKATVIHIDPAETEKDGVSNYKVRLSIEDADKSIVPGLTSDVFIETEKKSDILSLPVRATVTQDEKTYVYKKVEKDYVKTEVVLGSKDGKGNAEVISGVMAGDVILLTPPQK